MTAEPVGVKKIGTVIGIIVGVISILATVLLAMSHFYQTKEAAVIVHSRLKDTDTALASRQQVHEGDYNAHLVHAAAQERIVDETRVKLERLDDVIDNVRENLVRLMERQRVRPKPLNSEEEP